MDPLSDILSLLKPRSYMSGGIDVGGDLAIQFPQHPGIKCYALISGQCWLVLEGIPEAVPLKAGDCFLLPRGLPFSLTTKLSLKAVDAMTLFTSKPTGGVVTVNGGGDCFLAGGHFILDGQDVDRILGILPPIVHIREESDRAELRWSLERMGQELREQKPGGHLVVQHLAQMMLVQALRLHFAEGVGSGSGWFFALADKQMGVAINAMHANPAHRWTLQELAECSSMSRSTFALKFKETVGTSPMDYLTHWRMLLAGDRLQNSRDSISVIALSLGYESESAFSTAFKRVMGCSPRQYSSSARPPKIAPSIP